MNRLFKKFLCSIVALSLVFSFTAVLSDLTSEPVWAASNTYTFTDREGKEVVTTVKAFASYVVDFKHGDPWMNDTAHTDPKIALGLPDYKEIGSNSIGDLCMGKNGVLTLGFDIYINDGEGNDIYVFEVGGYVEETKVEVSNDLKKWYEIGYVSGNKAGLDLNGKIPEGSEFCYVRLTDSGKNPNGDWPGADIDAVCGLNTGKAVSIKAPAKAKLTNITVTNTNSIIVQCQKIKTNCKGYQIQISTKKDFSKKTTKNVTSPKATFKNLKKNTKYYIRVRAYNKTGKTKYGKWSTVRTVTFS